MDTILYLDQSYVSHLTKARPGVAEPPQRRRPEVRVGQPGLGPLLLCQPEVASEREFDAWMAGRGRLGHAGILQHAFRYGCWGGGPSD